MIHDATARKLPAEPLPDSYLSRLAQGVSSVTAKTKEQVHDLTKGWFPATKTAGWIVAAVFLGMWVQAKISDVELLKREQAKTTATLEEIRSAVQSIRDDRVAAQNAVIDLKAQMIATEEARKRFELEFRLFEDKVWGRVSHMPYTNPGRRSQQE